MNAKTQARLLALLVFVVCFFGVSAPANAWVQHRPAGAYIHPRGNSVVFEFYGNGLDLTIASDWRVYQESNSGQFVQPASPIVESYITKNITVMSGGKPLIGHLLFQRQKCPSTPDTSTFRAVIEYRDPSNAALAGPLTVSTKLFAFDKKAIMTFTLGGRSIDAKIDTPVTFSASEMALSTAHVAADSFALGRWAALDISTFLILLLLMSPRVALTSLPITWVRFAVGLAVGLLAGGMAFGAAHKGLNEVSGGYVLIAVVVALGLLNLAGEKITHRELIELAAGLVAGIAVAFPFAEFGMPSASAVALLSTLAGALASVLLCGVAAAVCVALAIREAKRRVRIDPKAVVNMQRIIDLAAILAAGYLAFRL